MVVAVGGKGGIIQNCLRTSNLSSRPQDWNFSTALRNFESDQYPLQTLPLDWCVESYAVYRKVTVSLVWLLHSPNHTSHLIKLHVELYSRITIYPLFALERNYHKDLYMQKDSGDFCRFRNNTLALKTFMRKNTKRNQMTDEVNFIYLWNTQLF